VPVGGIWRPSVLRIPMIDGCPNYLLMGLTAPPAVRASKRLDYPSTPNGAGDGMDPPYTDYTYENEPTDWELLWEDHRYEGGRVQRPEEGPYLAPETEPPPWPPMQPPPN